MLSCVRLSFITSVPLSLPIYTDNAAPKFAFMGSSSTTTPASSSLAPSIFGTPSSSSLAPTPAPTSTYDFGQGSSSDTPSKTFMFGQQETQPASAVHPNASNPAPLFVFGSLNSSNASPFSFGGAASTPASTG